MRQFFSHTLLASSLLFASCGAPAEAPAELSEIRVPAGFDFATSRSVQLTVEAQSGLDNYWLEIATGGAVLYRGPALAATGLLVATNYEAVQVEAVSTQGEHTQHTLPIDQGRAHLELQ